MTRNLIAFAVACLALARVSRAEEPLNAKPTVSPAPLLRGAEGKKAGEERDDNALKMKFCWCPSGTFRMGSPLDETKRGANEGPAEVTLSKGFWMGKFEVMQEEWRQVMGTSLEEQRKKEGYGAVAGKGPNYPMYFVNYSDAEEFCRGFTESERRADRLPSGWSYHLPTEAQWEYACRASSTTRYSFGDDKAMLGEHGWFIANSDSQTHVVGKKAANAFGIHDMHGNVFEWCRDGYVAQLPGGVDPLVVTRAPERMSRGGSWFYFDWHCRSASRSRFAPEFRYHDLGFRVARVEE